MKVLRLFLLVAVLACAGSEPYARSGTASPLYVDVRTPQEYAVEHVNGAVNIPVDQLEDRWTELKPYRNQRIVLYCRSGHRAGKALEILTSKGFKRPENGGGLDSLKVRGIATERAP